MFLHIDIDCFFISAERTKNKKLLNRPAAVGSRSNLEIFSKKRRNIKLLNINSGAFVTPVFHSDFKRTFDNYFVDKIENREKIRGIITTASYEARAYGVKTGMPIAKAISLCPKIVVVPANYPLYHKLSRAIFIFLRKRLPEIEQYSIDEFFGNVDGWIDESSIEEFAKSLKDDIYKEFEIPVSIGVAKAKYISKLATKKAKPYGVYVVKDQKEFIKDIPIDNFPGIGKGFSTKLVKYGIKTLGDLCKSKELLYRWKLPGIELYNRVCTQKCNTISPKEPRKSIGLSRTFDEINDFLEVKRRVLIMARHIAYMVGVAKVNPMRYELKVYCKDGVKLKGGAREERLFSEHLLKETLVDILQNLWREGSGVIKLRVSVSSFQKGAKTMSLLDNQSDSKQQKIDKAANLLRGKFGLDVLKNGNEI
jgi:DNA polymerase-4